MGKKSKPFVWTEENVDWLRKNYRLDNIDNCAEHFGVTRHYIMKVASKYKIPSGRYLTKEQVEFMEEKAHKSNQYFARKFGVSDETARKVRYWYCVGGIKDSQIDNYTCAEVGRIMGKEKSVISKCWCGSGLKYRYNGKYKMINRKDLIKFLKENPKKWDATKCEKWFFNGQKWFDEKHDADFEKMQRERWGDFY